MEPNSEKNHLDDLFARRLGKLERPPSADSFARLQQRMQGGQVQPRLVVWRNPAMQMLAAAACLAVALLFGWLYTNDQSANVSGKGQAVAVNEKKQPATDSVQGTQSVEPNVDRKTVQQLADNRSKSAQTAGNNRLSDYLGAEYKRGQSHRASTPAIARQVQKPIITPENKSVATPVMVAAVPVTVPTPKPAAERVLIVTIEEPEALVAARQTATSVVNNMPVLAASPTKEGKASFWNHVKRLKQDDDVARQEEATDESGLLSRAYKGIRQKLEKDKPVRQ